MTTERSGSCATESDPNAREARSMAPPFNRIRIHLASRGCTVETVALTEWFERGMAWTWELLTSRLSLSLNGRVWQLMRDVSCRVEELDACRAERVHKEPKTTAAQAVLEIDNRCLGGVTSDVESRRTKRGAALVGDPLGLGCRFCGTVRHVANGVTSREDLRDRHVGPVH